VFTSLAVFARGAEQRAFRLGFTPFAYDTTSEAEAETVKFLQQNGDIILHHLDNAVPWIEAWEGKPFHETVMKDWERRRKMARPGMQVYVALTPVGIPRSDLSAYWGAEGHMPLPPEFKGKTLNDPMIKKAYLTYCQRIIDFFHPDYLAIAIEINELYHNNRAQWPAYVELHKYIYREIKRDHPHLPLFATFTIHGMLDPDWADREEMLEAFKGLMDYNDLTAISFYPFFKGDLSGRIEEIFAWLTQHFDRFNKPYAIAETGEAAANLSIIHKDQRVDFKGSPGMQASYYERLFRFAQEKKFKFIIAFFHRDYDPWWEKNKANLPAWAVAWRDCGLVDEEGNKRPAYNVWRKYFDMPVAQNHILIGLDMNPPPSEPYTPTTLRKWFKIAVDAGVTSTKLSPIWRDIEKAPGEYDFLELESDSQLAGEFKLPIYLTIRVVDTNNTGVPASYAGWSFDDPRMAQKLKEFVVALAPHLHGEVKWVSIGNEVDAYFSEHKNEIAAYRKLLDQVVGTVRETFPGTQYTVNFTFEGLAGFSEEFKPIVDTVDFISLTYYPLNPDFTFRDPAVVRDDIKKMIEAAGSRKVFFQEIGYSSAERLNSSEEKQARFLKNIFEALREFQSHIIAAHFLWMSDIAQSLVDQFGHYYKLPSSENFKAYLATLGYFDRNGRPKAAWKVFQQEAQRMSDK
jgi:hypothetical protein